MTLFQWPSEWTGLEGELQSSSTGSLRGQPGPRTRASWPPEPCGPAGGSSGSAHGPCLTSQKVKAAQSRPTLCGPVGHTVSPRNSPGQSPGVRSLSLRQGIFLTQEWSRGLLLCRWNLYQLSCRGSAEPLWGSEMLLPESQGARGREWRTRGGEGVSRPLCGHRLTQAPVVTPA